MRMRNTLVLLWWLLLFACMQVAAMILDGSRHLEWGRLGVYLIKIGYLGFASVLLIRYLSFRSQRSFENLVDSYNRVANKGIEAEKVRKDTWLNPFLNLILVVVASVDFTLVFQWNEAVFKATVWLDFLIWALIIRWLGRAFWLKTKGTRERLKEVLDDARSRLRDQSAEKEVVEPKISKTPFALLSTASLLIALGISFARWERVRDVFRVDDLKACMDKCLRQATVRFYQHGELQIDREGEPCIKELQGKVDLSLDFRGSELRLRAKEIPSFDYFGNGSGGDEGLVLDATGRFKRTVIWKRQDQAR
ncbi:MAG: hypothetical protein ABIY63_04920 [Fibrobacteria bacterium]